MAKTLGKFELLKLANAVTDGKKVEVGMVKPFLNHTFEESSRLNHFMLRLAGWISLFFASVLVIFPEVGEWLIKMLPDFFLLPERLAKALDYIWGLVGNPVKKQHLMYHLPNIIVFTFGVAGVRQLWRRLNKNNWKDRVLSAQEKLAEMVADGTARISFAPGFSLLFVGNGDQVAKSLVMDDPEIGPTLGTAKPGYTNLWGRFAITEGDNEYGRVLKQFNSEEAGEYVLFPVVDEHLFLPGPYEYDTAPHRIEIAVRLIREHEKSCGWPKKRILIVGDKEQRSRFVTASQKGHVETARDEISLRTIENRYEDVIVVDPTDVTLKKIIEIADGRQVFFRASDRGAEKYSKSFYHRLSLLGYEPKKDATLTIGYDISDLETEHQVLSQNQDEYLPVILSRSVFDLLAKSHLRNGSYIFVPRLVKRELQRIVAQS